MGGTRRQCRDLVDDIGSAQRDEIEELRGRHVDVVDLQFTSASSGERARFVQVGERAGAEIVDHLDRMAVSQKSINEM
jgi:hypothetical protein